MKYTFTIACSIVFSVGSFVGCKNQDKENDAATAAAERNLVVDIPEVAAKVQPTMYGIFFEDINFAADGGLYAEMIKNRSFEFTLPKIGWIEPNSDRHSYNNESGILSIIKYGGDSSNHNFARAAVKNDQGYVLINEGFRGMGVKKDGIYKLSLKAAKHSGDIKKVHFQLVDSLDQVLGETTISLAGPAWKNYESEFPVSKTDLKARARITFTGTGEIDLDMISLFPKDTWKGREKGLRKDLVQLLADLKPGFLRFPGGCIVEGRTLASRYQWKKTLGDIEDRQLLINRWNTEFAHRPAPDYYQSFGLGFYEYFQLAEDLGAAPLPILSCGMACQFNTGELVSVDELDPYVKDALDLIEFANGDAGTAWGKVRADMGHPEPFNMKFIGIGNEQWGPAYIERYSVFAKAIKEKYPKITIVSGSGPFPEGDYFEYGWEQLRKLDAEVVDEHYYRPPQWFRDNAARYDNYDRNGPKVFAGEYAAQSTAIASPKNENNWDCALSEAAFMTGLERNAGVVVMTSYAPLMAHSEGWQWTPDLIWFNNLESYGTTDYYVQKLFSNNSGTDLMKITEDGKPLIGQEALYASAVRNSKTHELILKIVNTANIDQRISVDPGTLFLKESGSLTILSSDDLEAVNSFTAPKEISPRTEAFTLSDGKIKLTLVPQSLNIIRVSIPNT